MVALELVDPRFYHLDTALAVLDDETRGHVLPGRVLPAQPGSAGALYPDAILAHRGRCRCLGLNAVSDGRNVMLPAAAAAPGAPELRERGFHPVGLDLSELLKAGGGVKCCTLELREA